VRFTKAALPGAWLIDIDPIADDRGHFARLFCHDEFAAHGIPAEFVQSSLSFNHRRGTLRGLHFQVAPAAEGKLVRCTRGAVFDVMLDLRADSPTYLQWQGFDLTALHAAAVFIPPGLAHGFQTLADDTEIFYQMTTRHSPDHATGVRWNDAAFGITWPIADPILSPRDANYPDYRR
jgi:dTDP-4-dehydrorhamnose 3,5-epimerase